VNVNYPVPVVGAVASPRAEQKFPPVVPIACASLTCVVAGGIVMASYVPRRPPLAAPIALLALGVILSLVDVVILARLRGFAWRTFFRVAKWALLAYVISAGMIEFAFVRNHTRGAPLAVVTLMLVVFALDVPLNIAFTVARYDST
jgi:hypothetical protein